MKNPSDSQMAPGRFDAIWPGALNADISGNLTHETICAQNSESTLTRPRFHFLQENTLSDNLARSRGRVKVQRKVDVCFTSSKEVGALVYRKPFDSEVDAEPLFEATAKQIRWTIATDGKRPIAKPKDVHIYDIHWRKVEHITTVIFGD